MIDRILYMWQTLNWTPYLNYLTESYEIIPFFKSVFSDEEIEAKVS